MAKTTDASATYKCAVCGKAVKPYEAVSLTIGLEETAKTFVLCKSCNAKDADELIGLLIGEEVTQ